MTSTLLTLLILVGGFWFWSAFIWKPNAKADSCETISRVNDLTCEEAKEKFLNSDDGDQNGDIVSEVSVTELPESMREYFEIYGPRSFFDGEIHIFLPEDRRIVGLFQKNAKPIGFANYGETAILFEPEGKVFELDTNELGNNVKPQTFISIWHYLLYRYILWKEADPNKFLDSP